ncbi:hypothetical protein HUU05_08165 [candidate division KSB1 bacterium]|nr:hypothetical protein [candidate division KSB1 bacterium]
MSFRDDDNDGNKEAYARNGPPMVLFRERAHVFFNNGDGAFKERMPKTGRAKLKTVCAARVLAAIKPLSLPPMRRCDRKS